MSLYAQTGIGTKLPHGSAELEVASTDKGVLIPRLTLKSETDKSVISRGDIEESLLVYHKGIPTLEAGFYFWSENKWNALVSNSTLYNYIKKTAKDGNVSITNEGENNFIFKWIDKATDIEKTITLSELIKEFETITTLSKGTDASKAMLVYTSEDKGKQPTEIDLTELLENSSEFTDFLTTFVSQVSMEETITTIVSDGKGTYTYKNEGGIPVNITVVDDVANNFGDIIKNEEFKKVFEEYLTENVEGNVIYKEGKFYYTIKKGDTYEQKEVTIEEIVKDNAYLSSLVLTNANNANNVKGVFTFNDGKAGSTAIEFAETLTGVSSSTKEVIYDDTTTKGEAIVYNYKNEAENTDTLNLTEDVAKTFETIINTQGNKDIIKTIVTETAGTGAIAELKLVTDPKENVDEVKAGFTFKDGNNAANDVKFAETLTRITMEQFDMYIYMDPDPVTGDVIEVHVDTLRPEEQPNDSYKANKFVYENEKGDKIDIKGSDLFKTIGGSNGGNNNLETLTSLRIEKSTDVANPGKYLVYLDEKSQETYIPVKEIFDQDETITKLEVDLDKNSLIYTNETGVPNPISLGQIANEPWYVAKTTTQATKNDQDIYTQGWVGIGYDTPSDLTKVPNEKLRVNGSITATNSYYADYVFESYFDGYSSLKYDYKFNDLNTVDSFIKTNRHLPGITPISELRKTETGYSFNISELSIQLLEKTEELFLHVIDQQKELNAKESRIERLESEMTEMSDRLRALEALLTK